MSITRWTYPAASNVPRRRFLSGALLGASASFVPSNAFGPPPDDTTLLIPKPEDALADDLDLVRDIESNILRLYYVLVGRISRDLSSKQQKLKRDVEELERLAPQLKPSIDACRIKSVTAISRASTEYISRRTGVEPALIAGQVQLVTLSSERLNDLTRDFDAQQDSVPLSPEATALIGRIICQITELQKPTQDLNLASSALTKASNELRGQTGEVQDLMKEAIRFLIEATVKKFPTCRSTTADGVTKSQSDCAQPDPAGANELRLEAIKKLNSAKTKLSELEKSPIPESLKTYLKDQPDPKAGDFEASLPPNIGISVKQIQDLLEGAIRWIDTENKLSKRTEKSVYTPVSFASGEMQFFGALWFPRLWNEIRWVLETTIPELTDDRTEQIYRKKIRLNFMVYSEDQQSNFFVGFLPKLKQPWRPNLDRDTDKQLEAARALARLSSL